MQIYAELGDQAKMQKHEQAYEYYRRDGNATALSHKFRVDNPDANYAAQLVRVYQLKTGG